MSTFDIELFQDLLLQLRCSDSKFVKKDTVVAILQWLISNGERIAELLNDTFVDLDGSEPGGEEDDEGICDEEQEATLSEESMPDVVTAGAAALLREESKSSLPSRGRGKMLLKATEELEAQSATSSLLEPRVPQPPVKTLRQHFQSELGGRSGGSR